jgi:hypothetical protein
MTRRTVSVWIVGWVLLGLALGGHARAQQPEILEVDLGTFDLTTLSVLYPQFVFRPIDDLSPRMGARAVGMGGAYLAEARGVEGLAWNPAAIAVGERAALASDIYLDRSSGSTSGYPVAFNFPDAPPLFLTKYEENLKSRVRFGFLGLSGPVTHLFSRPLSLGISYRRHTNVAYPEEVVAEFKFLEQAGLPVIVATENQETGGIQAATLGMAYELLPGLYVGASANYLTGKFRARISFQRNVPGLITPEGKGRFALDYRGISFESGFLARVGTWLSVAGWVGWPHRVEVTNGAFKLRSLEIPGQPTSVVSGKLRGHEIETPLFYSLGLSLRPKAGWLLTADFNVRPWGEAKIRYTGPGEPGLEEPYPGYDVRSFHLGLEHELMRRGSYRVPVRVGFARIPLSMASVDGTDLSPTRDTMLFSSVPLSGDGDPIFFGEQVEAWAWSLGASLEFPGVSFHAGMETRSYRFERFFFESPGPLAGDVLVNPEGETVEVKRLENFLRFSAEYRF